MKQARRLINVASFPRRSLFGLLGANILLLGLPGTLWAEEAGGGHSGGGGGHAGGGGGEKGGSGGGGNGAGRTPSQRAVRHRQQTGRTLGGGETHGGGTGGNHGGGGGGDTLGNADTLPLQDGTTTGPVGGDSGGEHFIHEGLGDWSTGSKVLRGN